MGKLVVVKNDKVAGTDKHNVAGNMTTSSGPVPTTGFGMFDYDGKMDQQLSDFVKIDNKAVALKNSQSSLNPGESSPAGKHGGPNGKGLTPTTLIPPSLSITDPVGTGNPSTSAGSTFVKIASTAVLLDGDKIDTCDGFSVPMNSTVTAGEQSFVSCSQ